MLAILKGSNGANGLCIIYILVDEPLVWMETAGTLATAMLNYARASGTEEELEDSCLDKMEASLGEKKDITILRIDFIMKELTGDVSIAYTM